jgi:hypothetical protein
VSSSGGDSSAEDLGRSLESADFDLFAEVAREMEDFRMNSGDHELFVPSVVVSQQLHSSGGGSGTAARYDWTAAAIDGGNTNTNTNNGVDPTMLNSWL